MKILNRYVLKEHVGPLLFSLTALTSLMLLNYIAKRFGDLVGKGLPWSTIGEFFWLSIPFTVAMTLPMAVLVSVLYAFSRLASENEVTALKASGVSLVRIMVTVLGGASLMTGLMIVFNDQVLPRANHRLRVLTGDIAQKKPTFALREQVINEVSPGKLFLRANHLDEGSNRMREITIYDLGDPTRRRTIYADSGNMGMTENRRDLELTLYKGQMQEVALENPAQLQRLFYDVDRIKIRNVGNELVRTGKDSYKSDREMSVCEMQHEYAAAERDQRVARRDLEEALVRMTQEAASGVSAPPTSSPADTAIRPSIGLGRMYCDLLDAAHVPAAGAATLDDTNDGDGSSGDGSIEGAKAFVPAPSPAVEPALEPAVEPAIQQQRAPTDGRRLTSAEKRRFGPQIRARRDSAFMQKGQPTVVPNTPAPVPAAVADAGLQELRSGVTQSAAFSDVSGSIESAQARIKDHESAIDTYGVEIHKKFALSFACMVFVLLGAPIALRFPRGGVGLTIGVSLGVFALYYVGLIFGEAVANRGTLSPFWAMWASNILSLAIGLVLLARMGREGATARGGDAGEMIDALRAWSARQLDRMGFRFDRRRRAA